MTSGIERLEALVGSETREAARRGEVSPAVQLISTGTGGRPHVAWLSAGEVLVVDGDRVAICLWETSRTTRNLDASGHALLHAVAEGAIYKWTFRAARTGTVTIAGQRMAGFVARIEDSETDVVTYADVLGGPTFRLTEAASEVADRWALQIRWLRDLTAGS